MFNYTTDQLETIVNKTINPDDYKNYDFYHLEVNIIKQDEKELLFEVTRMYDCPPVGFKQLKALSEIFQTDNIDKYDDISSSGCETCDYGSRYGHAFRVWK